MSAMTRAKIVLIKHKICSSKFNYYMNRKISTARNRPLRCQLLYLALVRSDSDGVLIRQTAFSTLF